MTFEVAYRAAVEGLFAENLPGFSDAKRFCLGGGKRLRPNLLLDAFEVWSQDSALGTRNSALSAAIATELLHHYLLIHDDIMDGDELRRDEPTLHAAAIQKYGQEQGMGIALVIGDYVANEAYMLFANASGQEKDSHLARVAAEITKQTILGQLREYVSDAAWTIEDLEDFYAFKTAAYSIKLPLLSANILAGHDEERARLIEEASRELGVAYQFHDDLIEFRGEKKRNADGTGGDIARGKMTIVSRLLLDALSSQSLQSLAEMPIAELRAIASEKKILEKIQEMIDERIKKAEPMLEKMGIRNTATVEAALKMLRS